MGTWGDGMRIAGRDKLLAFARKHADARGWIERWCADIGSAEWTGPADVKACYPHASLLSRNRFVFNIKGKSYRMLATIAYEAGVVVVNRVGTHAEYDAWRL
jgi:mRNA interferase HigB